MSNRLQTDLRIASQAGRLSFARLLMLLPCSLLAGRRAVLGALATCTDLDLQQRFTDARHVGAPARAQIERPAIQFKRSPVVRTIKLTSQ